jgi:hypothetical protein
MSYKGELLFEGTKFKSYFKQDLIIEQTFLEYDEIPLLCACLDEEGNRYFCNCTEFRTYEKWAIYPVSILQLLKMVKNEVTPADTFDVSTVVYVFTIDWENESEKFEKKTVSELTKYDRLPDNIYLTSHPNRLEKYADSLQTVYKAQTALCCSKRYVACCVRSVDVTNELLSSLILSKANYPVRLNVEISIGKNHRDIQLQETNNIDIIHMTKSDYACVSV